jgi:hypothetical protein
MLAARRQHGQRRGQQVPPTQKPRVLICLAPESACTVWMARMTACSM